MPPRHAVSAAMPASTMRGSTASVPTAPPSTTSGPMDSLPMDAGESAARQRRRDRALDLFRLARTADERGRRRIRDEIVVQYLEMADAVAHRFASRPQDWSDVRQVAYVGLIKAVDRFDPDKADDFASFAVPTIAGEIKRHLRDNGWVVRPPRPLQELHGTVVREIPRIAQEIGHDPSSREIADGLGESVERVAEALTCRQGMSPASLDAAVHGDDGDGFTLADTLGAPSDDLERAELVQTLRTACIRLTPRERRIVFLRFFREQTQSEIAMQLGVTQMQVSRLLTKILSQLRSALAQEPSAAA